MKKFYVCILVSFLIFLIGCRTTKLECLKENSYELDKFTHSVFVKQLNTLESLGIPESLIIKHYGFNPFYSVRSSGNAYMSKDHVKSLGINGLCDLAYSKGYRYVALLSSEDKQNIYKDYYANDFGIYSTTSVKHKSEMIAVFLPNEWSIDDETLFNKIKEEGLTNSNIINTIDYVSPEVLEKYSSL